MCIRDSNYAVRVAGKQSERTVFCLPKFTIPDGKQLVVEMNEKDGGRHGASGDLVQLAHIALTLIGEGEVFYQGKKRDTASVLAENGLQPFQMHIREGLSLIHIYFTRRSRGRYYCRRQLRRRGD